MKMGLFAEQLSVLKLKEGKMNEVGRDGFR
jgi:hypothetical protein